MQLFWNYIGNVKKFLKWLAAILYSGIYFLPLQKLFLMLYKENGNNVVLIRVVVGYIQMSVEETFE